MFKDYESKPVMRSAHLVTINDVIAKVEGEEASYTLNTDILFKAYEPVSVGDYIVRLTVEDTYHCSAKVFRERNIVPDT